MHAALTGTHLDYGRELSARQQQFSRTPELAAQRERVRAALALSRGERVLEIGCGDGLLTYEMAREVGEVGRVTGGDISPVMAAMARDLCAASPNVDIVAVDAARLPFSDGAFDVAVIVQCFCLVGDVEAAIAELFRVLRCGGRAIILDTDWDTVVWNSTDPALMARIMEHYKATYADARLPRKLSRLLRAAGFDLISRDQFAILNWRLEPESFSGQQIGFTQAVSEDVVPSEDLDAWVHSIQAAADNDVYFFSLNRYVFNVMKPCRGEAP